MVRLFPPTSIEVYSASAFLFIFIYLAGRDTEYQHSRKPWTLAVMYIMQLKSYQIKICSALLKEKIINSRIEQKILQNRNVKSIKSYYNGLLKRKTRILELTEAAKKAGIEIDIVHFLSNIDIMDVKSVVSEFEQKLPFNAQRKKIIIKLAQTEVSQKMILSLAKSSNEQEFDRIIETIPPAFLMKHGLLKTKDHSISTKNSLRSLSTPMRD